MFSESRVNTFDMVLLVVGIGVAFLGFQFINQAYKTETGQVSWLMIIAIFSWLTLLVLFILLSLMVDASRKEVSEIRTLISLLENKKKK